MAQRDRDRLVSRQPRSHLPLCRGENRGENRDSLICAVFLRISHVSQPLSHLDINYATEGTLHRALADQAVFCFLILFSLTSQEITRFGGWREYLRWLA